MAKIFTLSKKLANQIAAGEVVERPVSVVKELVENSLDAGATEIRVEIKKGGLEFIKVSDNGEGIDANDLLIATDKYTTSKIKDLEDLYNVMTFGFRGEALASISSVSEFSIISKTKSQLEGNKLFFQGDEKKVINISSENGTQILVENLFFNTPARLNYLKTERTEYSHISDFLESISLAYPNVRIEFISDEKRVFLYSETDGIEYRIKEILGSDFYSHILPINLEFSGVSVTGFISNPKISFANKNRQKIFVNKRIIKSPMISKAVSDAYNRFIPHGNNSAYVLFLNVDPTIVDVNVHPRKMEIRFADEKSIFRSVYHAVSSELERVSLIGKDIDGEALASSNFQPPLHTTPSTFQQPEKYYTGSGTKFKNYSPYKEIKQNPNQTDIGDAIDFSRQILSTHLTLEESEEKTFNVRESPLGKIIGQIFNSYILVENNDKLTILDQHALAERVIYERLVSTQSGSYSQGLLIPVHIEITSGEQNIISEYKEVFESMGFELELLGTGSVLISGIPDFIKKEDIKNIFLGVLDDVSRFGTGKSKTLEEVKNKIFAYTACRSAVKFGDPLSLFEINKLLQDSVTDYSSTCPHGRPVVYEVNIHDLKGKFER